jgi:hypothetical protein
MGWPLVLVSTGWLLRPTGRDTRRPMYPAPRSETNRQQAKSPVHVTHFLDSPRMGIERKRGSERQSDRDVERVHGPKR